MTVGQEKLVENYNSLLRKLELDDTLTVIDIGNVIRFCSLFWSDDVELFKEFDLISRSSSNSATGEFSYENINRVIKLFAKRYGLNLQAEMEKVMYLFIQNAINNGISYHLGSSANFQSIMELGLGIEAIGFKTEEREDYEKLISSGGEKLLPFRGSNASKLFYSNKPILGARYGIKPEWLMELKLNYVLVADIELKRIVDDILKKYDEKYKDAYRMLFLIPFQKSQLSETTVGKWLSYGALPSDIVSGLWSVLEQKDLHTSSHIPSSDILAVDLKDFSMYCRDEYGDVKKIVNGINRDKNFNR